MLEILFFFSKSTFYPALLSDPYQLHLPGSLAFWLPVAISQWEVSADQMMEEEKGQGIYFPDSLLGCELAIILLYKVTAPVECSFPYYFVLLYFSLFPWFLLTIPSLCPFRPQPGAFVYSW